MRCTKIDRTQTRSGGSSSLEGCRGRHARSFKHLYAPLVHSRINPSLQFLILSNDIRFPSPVNHSPSPCRHSLLASPRPASPPAHPLADRSREMSRPVRNPPVQRRSTLFIFSPFFPLPLSFLKIHARCAATKTRVVRDRAQDRQGAGVEGVLRRGVDDGMSGRTQ